MSLIRNYVVIAWRTLWRQRAYTITNVAGLAVGLSVFVWMALYVLGQMQYDQFHDHADRIVRVRGALNLGTDTKQMARMSSPVGPSLQRNVADVDAAVRFWQRDEVVLARPDVAGAGSYDRQFVFADSAFFSVFSFDVVKGDPTTALRDPFSLVLTETTADTYFPDSDPVGQSMTYRSGDASHVFTVTGVVKDPPYHSSIQFRFLASFSSLEAMEQSMLGSWNAAAFPTYLQLAPGTDRAALTHRINETIDAQTQSELIRRTDFSVEPLTDVHFSDAAGLTPPGDVRIVYILSSIALLVLLVAGANYVNLTTAHSTLRAREVGVRKAVGAPRSQLMTQLLGESVGLSLIGLLAAGLLSAAALPWIDPVLPGDFSLREAASPTNVAVLLAVVGAVGVASGFYPAVVLSSFDPAEVLRNRTANRVSGSTFRQVTVIFQFGVCTALILGAVVMEHQLDFVQSKSLGLATDGVAAVRARAPAVPADRVSALRSELARRPTVHAATVVSAAPTRSIPTATVTAAGLPNEIVANVLRTDPHFDETLDVKVKQGRAFRPEEPATNVLINETARRTLGWDRPVGRTLRYGGKAATVVGVIEDVHLASMREAIQPLIVAPMRDEEGGYVLARLNPQQLQAGLDDLRDVWESLVSGHPLPYFFLDDAYAELHRASAHLSTLFRLVIALTLFIAGVGLYGLTTFTARSRRKEIGIRKTFGATRWSIVRRFGTDFLWMVGAAYVIGAPLAYVEAQQWLQQFAYHVDLGIGVFVSTGVSILTVVGLIVVVQALRAASIPPIETLRNE